MNEELGIERQSAKRIIYKIYKISRSRRIKINRDRYRASGKIYKINKISRSRRIKINRDGDLAKQENKASRRIKEKDLQKKQ